jgi:hypothetical protein
MTEQNNKPKRGRPVGSARKTHPNSIVNPLFQMTGKPVYEDNEPSIVDPDLLKEAIEIEFYRTRASNPSAPYPSNWNEMSKIKKLEWLTANPR